MSLITISIFVAGVLVGAVLVRLRMSSTNAQFDEGDTTNALREKASQAVSDRIEKRKDRIVATANREGRITNDGVEDLYCISDQTASRYLSQLVEEGKLLRHGSGRGIYYTVASQPPEL